MGKQPAKNANIALGGTAIESEVAGFNLEVTQEVPKVDAFGVTGPRRVVGNYDFGLGVNGDADFASGESDALIFALVGDADGAAVTVDPTGETAGTDDPNYDSTMVLESYSIAGQVGGAVTYQAQMRGTSVLSRATS